MGDEALAGGSAAESVSWQADAASAVFCVLFGVVMSVLPYALWWPRVGGPVWVADNDELYYLQFAGQAYFHHPASLSDPVVPGEGTGSAYSVVALSPGIIAARVLDLGPLGAAFFWRLGAGVGVGAMMFLVIRHFLGRPYLAAALACLLMADAGTLGCHLLVRQWVIAARVLAGRAGDLLATNPRIHPEWRIINPGPSLPFLLLHVLLVARARDRPTPLRLGLAGAGLGLLFYVYFYYYTAACLALVLAFVLDAGHRRVYFHVGWVGGLIGLPGVVGSYLLKRSTSPDWLQRSDKFLPIPHLSQLMIPWVACGLLAVGLIWVLVRRRDLVYVGLLGLAGLVLANHQVVTGLQIENYHWCWVWAPMIGLLTVILAATVVCERFSGSRAAVAVLVGLWAVHLVVGIWLRGVEVTRSKEPVELVGAYVGYQADRRAPGVKKLAPDSVIGGDQRFVHLATILEDQRPLSGYAAMLSPYVDDASWTERIALNAYLRGLGVPDYEAEQRRDMDANHWGPWGRDPAERAALLARRRAAFDAVVSDPRPALSRYDVRYVALPAGHDLPAAIRTEWERVRAGTSWDVFEARKRADGGNQPM